MEHASGGTRTLRFAAFRGGSRSFPYEIRNSTLSDVFRAPRLLSLFCDLVPMPRSGAQGLPVDSRYEVWALPARRIRAHSYLVREVGIRLIPQVSAAGADISASAGISPPATRKRSIRELMGCLQAQGPIGYPPATVADAVPVYSHAAYQSAIIGAPM